MRNAILALLLTCSPLLAGDVFERLPNHPGQYTFRLYAEDGYAWDGRKTITVGPYWFPSQRAAWRWVHIPHVRQIIRLE